MCQKRIDVHVMVLDPVSTPSKCPTRNRGSIFCIYTKISHISSYDLNRHVTSVHKQEKPCKCELCNHYFSRKSSLLNHVASVHEKKKHFECEFCDKKCSKKSNLNIHVSMVHKQEKPFKCELCDQHFLNCNIWWIMLLLSCLVPLCRVSG